MNIENKSPMFESQIPQERTLFCSPARMKSFRLLRFSGLFIVLFALVNFGALYAQAGTMPPLPADGSQIPTAVFPLLGDVMPEELAPAYKLMVDAVRSLNKYQIDEIAIAPENPDVPPTQSESHNQPLALTSMLFFVPEAGETHCQLWLYDMRSEKLIVTDEMVYGDIDEAAEFMPPLVEYIFSNITDEMGFTTTSTTGGVSDTSAVIMLEPAPVSGPSQEPKVDDQSTFPDIYKKFYISAQYSPIFTAFGTFVDTEGFTFFPGGVNIDFKVLPWRTKYGLFGLKTNFTYNYLAKTDFDVDYAGHLIGANIDAVYGMPFLPLGQEWLVYAGAGMGYQLNYQFEYGNSTRSTAASQIGLGLNLGSSYQLIIWKGLFWEIGAEFDMLLSVKDAPMGYIRMQTGIGWAW